MPQSNANDSNTDPYDTSWMGASPEGPDPFLNISLADVAQKHDYAYQLILYNEPGFAAVFGLNYRVYQVLAMRWSGVFGHPLAPDVTMFVSDTPGECWARVKQRADPEDPFRLANTELVKNLDWKRDANQVWSNLMAFRNKLGRHFNLRLTIVVTAPPPPSVERPRLMILSGEHTSGPNKEGIVYAGIVYIDECLAADLPESVLRTPFGAAGALLCKDGLEEKYVQNAFHLWYDYTELWSHHEAMRFWIVVLDMRPGLRELYVKFLHELNKEKIMAMETDDLYAYESAPVVVNAHLSMLPDPTRVELVRKLLQEEKLRGDRRVEEAAREKAVAERAAERAAKRAAKEKAAAERAAKAATKRATERATRQTHVALLLKLLRMRGIELSTRQRAQLKQMTCEELPDIAVAYRAEDAEDFARRAKLQSEE